MKNLKFKTNINCSGCVGRVTPTLNGLEGVEEWNVNVSSPEKTLEVKTESAKESDIIEALSKVGFKAEKVD